MSTFNPDTDANFVAYLKKRATLNAELAVEFDQALIQYFMLQGTDSQGLSASAITTAISNAEKTAKAKKRQF